MASIDSLLRELARAPERDPEPAALLHYRILRKIGEGGMGAVYKAHDEKLGRIVALKRVSRRPEGDERARTRLLREARAASALNHPNIVTIHAVEEAEGDEFIVMEYVEGETLEALLRNGPLPPGQVLALGAEVADALACAHAAGILHRDIKPANVVMTAHGAKVLDFGIAAAAREPTRTRGAESRRLTSPGAAVGTAGYMSPEQLRDEPLDGRSDVFSLGAVLYEAATGRHAFAATDALAYSYEVASIDPPPPTALVPGLPAGLDEVVLRALAKDRARRFGSAANLAEALRRLAGGRRPPAATAIPAAIPSIAVLPFADMSPQKDQEYLSDGVAEEITNALAQIEGLRVIGRTSAFSFKGKNEDVRSIGHKLGVAHVLEGSVRTDGTHLRITAQLIDASDGHHLWTRSFDRETGRIFAVQDEIAREVVVALKVRLLPGNGPGARERPTTAPAVYTQVLLGRQFSKLSTVDGFRRAVQAYERALAMDPSYAPAWALLAIDLVFAADFSDTATDSSETRRRAETAAERAVALGPDLAESYAARAALRSRCFEWARARTDVERALALNPGDAVTWLEYSYLLAALGQLREGIVAARKAAEIDPLWSKPLNAAGKYHNATGELDLAESALQRALEIAPEHFSVPYHLGTTYLLRGTPRAALAAFQRATPEANALIGVSMAQHDLGHRQESHRALDDAAARYSATWAFQLAEGYAWCDQRDRAFEWLDRALAQRDGGLLMVKFTPLLRSVRGDPRYHALLRRLNLPVD